MDPLRKENFPPHIPPNIPPPIETKRKSKDIPPPNRPPPPPPIQQPVYRKLENSPIPLPETAPLPRKKASKPKNVSFKQTVEHRLYRGKVTQGKYVREVSDRKDLPLVDESSGTDAKSLTKREAMLKVYAWWKEIKAWKAKPVEERPTGHSMHKDWHRKDPSLSTKALTGRGESKIRKSHLSPSWIANCAPLERMARQAELEMQLEELPLTRENLIKYMLQVNEMGRDMVTKEDLEDMLYILYPNMERDTPEQEMKQAMTPREKWLIESILHAGLQGVDDIRKMVDGKFLIKYQRYTREEIENYVENIFKEKA